MANQDLHKLQQDVEDIQRDMADIKTMLQQLVHPALSLSVKEKAAAINRARATGDKRVLREALREINGE